MLYFCKHVGNNFCKVFSLSFGGEMEMPEI